MIPLSHRQHIHPLHNHQAKMATKQLKLVGELSGHQDKAWHLAWSPTEPILASCSSDKNVKLHRYNFAPASSSEAAPPASSSESTVRFQLKEVVVTGHKRTVRQVAWSPSGRTLATASFDSTVGIWEKVDESMRDGHEGLADDTDSAPEWECIGTLEGHDSECKSTSFSPKGDLLASCSRDRSVWIWEGEPTATALIVKSLIILRTVHPDSEFDCLSVLMEHSQDVKTVAWHPKEEVSDYVDWLKTVLRD